MIDPRTNQLHRVPTGCVFFCFGARGATFKSVPSQAASCTVGLVSIYPVLAVLQLDLADRGCGCTCTRACTSRAGMSTDRIPSEAGRWLEPRGRHAGNSAVEARPTLVYFQALSCSVYKRAEHSTAQHSTAQHDTARHLHSLQQHRGTRPAIKPVFRVKGGRGRGREK